MATTLDTVHYPGAGWDDSFLRVKDFQSVRRFVLYDILPYQTYYCICHPATALSDTPEHFAQTLAAVFGPPLRTTRSQHIFVREGKHIHYRMYHDADRLNLSARPRDAVYLRNMQPSRIVTWQPIFVACDHRLFTPDHERPTCFRIVHVDDPCCGNPSTVALGASRRTRSHGPPTD